MVVGLDPILRIDKSSERAGRISMVNRLSHKKALRYTDSDYSWKEFDKSIKRIHIQHIKTKEDPFKMHADMVLFDDPKAKKPSLEEEVYSSGVDYRSLEGNKRKKEDSESEEEEEGESFDDSVRKRTIEFNRRLNKEPHNVQLWLDFIRFQDETVQGLNTGTAPSSKSNTASLNEVKLSIFEKAIDANPDNEQLILEYLKCGGQIWETLSLLREWDTMLKKHPDSIILWSNYINLRQTNFASFSFTQCVQIFEDAISILRRQMTSKRHNTYEDRENIESLMVYVLLRACLFMKQSGYHERAYSILQASVEFNLFQPELFKMSNEITTYESKVNSFSDFWDSEASRFGEEGALGWSEYYRLAQNGQAPNPPANVVTGEGMEDDIETLEDWLSHELIKEEKERMPLRMCQAEDDIVEEDPYRITLSDDIRSFLFNITSEEARQSLVYSVFVFLGLPYTPPDVGTNVHFSTDTFTHNDINLSRFWPSLINQTKHLVWYVSGVPMEPEHALVQNDPYNIPACYPVGLSELFAKHDTWYSCLGKQYLPSASDEIFTRNAFQQLLRVTPSSHLSIYYLSFESSCGHKLGRRLAKSLLKNQRSNLILWNAYAQMEKYHDRIDEARKVYLTVFSMYHTFPEKEQMIAPLLYAMFAKLELENNRPNEALKILASISDNKPYDEKTTVVSTPVILRAREYFLQQSAQLSILSDSRMERQAAFSIISCYALFEYLSTGITNALTVYENALSFIQDNQAERGYESEIVWVEYAWLLYRHANNKGGYKVNEFRKTMERALTLFPNNTIFISLFVWNESKSKFYNRVQTLFNNALRKDSNVILWLSAIYCELHKYQPYQVHAVRDLFERSIDSESSRSSILLWKLYIEFEMRQGNTERAKNLFYRSIRECPWSKELYLIGLRDFKGLMTEKELNELIVLMMEKEIRLRIPIEDELLN
ncbi:NRDE-2, necessary for RNA interference-domain-containing protein [Pilobolus umbonatus]|nr:NRDE-2, necessary for RNA interference-domain-containing protein [Pilobolus umbonatus]